jgi:hypothetical protein
MLESKIATSDLTGDEPILAKFSSDWSTIITNALDRLHDKVASRLSGKGGDLRKLCSRLDIIIDGDSVEDTIGRRRLVYQLSSAASNKFKLQGSNDNTTFEDIGSEITITTTTEMSYKLTKLFKYYKVIRTSGTTSFSLLYLVETSFELAHKLLALSMAFRSQSKLAGDDYEVKADQYNAMFTDVFGELSYSLDEDEDGEIDETTELNTGGTVSFQR